MDGETRGPSLASGTFFRKCCPFRSSPNVSKRRLNDIPKFLYVRLFLLTCVTHRCQTRFLPSATSKPTNNYGDYQEFVVVDDVTP